MSEQTPKALSLCNVGYSYGAKRALDDVSFCVDRGQFCALLGPNGAGKSTLFSLLTRLFVTGEGRIEVAGHDLARRAARRAFQDRCGVPAADP